MCAHSNSSQSMTVENPTTAFDVANNDLSGTFPTWLFTVLKVLSDNSLRALSINVGRQVGVAEHV